MVPTINQTPRRSIYSCLDLGCKVVTWTIFSTRPESVEFHWCEWTLNVTLRLCWGNSCEWRWEPIWTSHLWAALVVVRLSFWEEDNTQSSRQLGSAVCDKLVSRVQKGGDPLVSPLACCFHLALCSSLCLQILEGTEAFQYVAKSSFALGNIKD